MKPRWKNKPGCNVDRIAADLERRAVRKPGENAAFGMRHMFCEASWTLLGEAIECSKAIPRGAMREGLMLSAACRAANKGTITSSSILRAFSELQAEFLREPKEEFVLVTAMTGPRGFTFPKTIRYDECDLRFSTRPSRSSDCRNARWTAFSS